MNRFNENRQDYSIQLSELNSIERLHELLQLIVLGRSFGKRCVQHLYVYARLSLYRQTGVCIQRIDYRSCPFSRSGGVRPAVDSWTWLLIRVVTPC